MTEIEAAGPFRAFVVRDEAGKRQARVEEISDADLPAGELLVAVEYSSLNYKDGLALTGKSKVLRGSPMVPGIDLAGRVLASASPSFDEGDRVIVTGWGLGEGHFGGYAQRARVASDWALALPPELSTRRAMALGTAGLTAALSVMRLEEHGLRPGGREVLVTGAAGGVGGVAVMLLAALGYRVAASTGRPAEREYLEGLGAARILAREELAHPAQKPLESETWAGVIDTVGGLTLATALRQTAYGGVVAACGLAGGSDLPASVLPFILRGVSLHGIDSVHCPIERRVVAWGRLARSLSAPRLDAMTREITLAEVAGAAEAILRGEVRGRLVVDVNR